MTKEAGLLEAGQRFGSGCAFVDYDRDGKLDLFVSNYLVFDPKVHTAADESGSMQLSWRACELRSARTTLWTSFAISQQRRRDFRRCDRWLPASVRLTVASG